MVSFGKRQPLKKQSLSKFKQNAEKEIKRIKDSDEPESVTVDGKPAVVVLSAVAYRKLATDAEFANHIKRLRRSIAQAKRGETHDWRVVHKELDQEINSVLGTGRK